MNLFAQVPSPLDLGGWTLCAAAMLGFLNQGKKFVDGIRGKPPAEQLQLTGDLMSRRLDVVENTIDRVAHDQDERRRAIYSELNKLNERFNKGMQDVAANVASLQTASDLTNQRLVQLDGKLDRLIERGR